MADFSVRSDSVDVEQIMRQIRARIREKRGADYTEAELQQLASVKLEKFLDPRGLRSDLVEQFRKHRVVSEAPPNYAFEDSTLYETHRGVLRTIRRLLNPILKLFINPNPVASALHIQAKVNAEYHRRFRQREEMDPLFYEVIHNLVLEVTRLGIEVHNLTMRVESQSARLDFDERRARSLETVVQYKTPPRPRPDRPERNDRNDRNDRSDRNDRNDRRDRPDRQAQDRPDRADRADRQDRPARPEPPVAPPPVVLTAAPHADPDDDTEEDGVEGGEGAAETRSDQATSGTTEGQGERRRRRRRRRRRPGQTMGDRVDGRGPAVNPGEAGLGAVREEGSPSPQTPTVPGSPGGAPTLHTGPRATDDGAPDQ